MTISRVSEGNHPSFHNLSRPLLSDKTAQKIRDVILRAGFFPHSPFVQSQRQRLFQSLPAIKREIPELNSYSDKALAKEYWENVCVKSSKQPINQLALSFLKNEIVSKGVTRLVVISEALYKKNNQLYDEKSGVYFYEDRGMYSSQDQIAQVMKNHLEISPEVKGVWVKWTFKEEKSLLEAVKLYNSRHFPPAYSSPCIVYEPSAFGVIHKYLLTNGGCRRDVKQIQSKWVHDLSTYCIRGGIKSEHKERIKELCKKHENKYSEVAKAFAQEVFPGKEWGYYYSANAIKNCHKNVLKIDSRHRGLRDLKNASEAFEDDQLSEWDLLLGDEIPSLDELLKDEAINGEETPTLTIDCDVVEQARKKHKSK